jgi:SAM-dependent methyltransferase
MSEPTTVPASAPAATESTPKLTDAPLAVAEEFHGESPPRDDDNDRDSALGDSESSTASVASSILQYRTINGRTYHSDRSVNADAIPYWGANDDRQNHNLDIMHEVFTLALDNKLYLAPLPKTLNKVLDIGTGTGQWCIDFGDDHPECQVIGTDLSPIQPQWVPPNVMFEIDDFNQIWTREDSSLDFVHLRWVVGTITDWTELFRQAYRVLKPGGWIETFDCNGFPESDDGTLTEETALHTWGYLIREGAKALGSKASFSAVQEGLQVKGLTEANFTRITEHPMKIPVSEWAKDKKYKQMGLYFRATLENDTEGAIGFLASQLGWTKEEISVYAARLRRELRTNSVHAFCRFNLVYAQKPLNG